MSLKTNCAIVFVHYDKNNIVDDYVYYYLKELQKNASHLVFVSTAKLSENTIERVSLHCSKVIVRDNVGYDFMSYKVGLESFDYKAYDGLLICNDSVYGPLYPLQKAFERMKDNKCDFWGMTDNTDMSYHLQSYFLVFKNNVIRNDAFEKFWNNVRVLNDKNEIIEKYEIGLTKHLLDNGFTPAVYTNFKPSKKQIINILLQKLTPTKVIGKLQKILTKKDKVRKIGKINSTHHFWKELLVEGKSPFIKIELLRDNPMNSDISDWEEVVNSISDYDTTLINNHLERMKADSK